MKRLSRLQAKLFVISMQMQRLRIRSINLERMPREIGTSLPTPKIGMRMS
jgi:hypothetical protein